MTTSLTFDQQNNPQFNLGLRTNTGPAQRSGMANLLTAIQNANQMQPSVNVQQLAQPQQPMAQPMAQGQGPSFRFQDLNRAFQLDPRNTLANTLMQQGMRGGPVRTPLEGIGRLSQSLVGAMLQKRALDRLEGQETTRQSNLQAQQDAITATLPPNLQSMFTGPATAQSLQQAQQLNLQKQLAPTSEFAIQQTPQGSVFGVRETDAFGNVTFKPSGQQTTPRPVAPPKPNIITLINKDDPNDVVTGDVNSEQIKTALASGKSYTRQTSGTNININQEAETEFEKEAAKQAVAQLGKLREQFFQDAELENRLDIAESLLEGGTETGPFTEVTIGLRGALKQLGVLNDEQVQNLTNQEVLRTSFNYLIPRQRVPGSGATSDFEARLFSQATANLANTSEANLILIKGFQALVERKKKIFKEMEKYARQNKSLLEVADFIDETVPPAFKVYNTDNQFDDAVEKGELKKGDLYFNGKLGIFDFYEG